MTKEYFHFITRLLIFNRNIKFFEQRLKVESKPFIKQKHSYLFLFHYDIKFLQHNLQKGAEVSSKSVKGFMKQKHPPFVTMTLPNQVVSDVYDQPEN